MRDNGFPVTAVGQLISEEVQAVPEVVAIAADLPATDEYGHQVTQVSDVIVVGVDYVAEVLSTQDDVNQAVLGDDGFPVENVGDVITPVNAADVRIAPNNTVVTALTDEPMPPLTGETLWVNITAAPESADEGGTVDYTVEVVDSQGQPVPVTDTLTVSFTYAGPADEISDFSPVVSVDITAGQSSETFSINVADDGLTDSSASSFTVGDITGVFSADGSELVLSGDATKDDYEAIMQQVMYRSTHEDPTFDDSHTSREIAWTITDDNDDLSDPNAADTDVDGQHTFSGTSTVDVVAQSDAPVIHSQQAQALQYTENGQAVQIIIINSFRQRTKTESLI
jgi:hypothetical protein